MSVTIQCETCSTVMELVADRVPMGIKCPTCAPDDWILPGQWQNNRPMHRTNYAVLVSSAPLRASLTPNITGRVIGGMTFDLDKWWTSRQKQMHDEQREQLGATCPKCGADMLDDLIAIAHEDCDCPSSVMVDCGCCGAEIAFALKWEMILSKATVVSNLGEVEEGHAGT